MSARTLSRPGAMEIPLIDFSEAFSSRLADRERVAESLYRAGTRTGFFYMAGHGVPTALVEAQLDYSRRFFAMSKAQKQALHLRHSACRRGYENPGDQTLDAAAAPDLKESYYCGIDFPPDHPFVIAGYDSYGVSQWPDDLPGFREQMTKYLAAHRALCEKIMQITALALSLNEHYFDGTFTDPMITLRLLRYPPHPQQASRDAFGAGAHTDWGAVTTLAQDEVGGLQVLGAEGKWVDAVPIAGTFVVNFGDMMPRWTNGRIKSNLHRVINANASRQARYSVPFFFSPRYTATIAPVPTCVAPGERERYATCTAGEHITKMVDVTYGRGPARTRSNAG